MEVHLAIVTEEQPILRVRKLKSQILGHELGVQVFAPGSEVVHVHALTHFGTYQFKLRIQVTGQAEV